MTAAGARAEEAQGLLATDGATLVRRLLANPVPGLGIAEPVFVPCLATPPCRWLTSARLATLTGADRYLMHFNECFLF
jgi:hypothetical protein